MALPAATEESRERYYRRGLPQQLHRVFSSIDLDGDGRLSPVELKTFMRGLGYLAGRREIAEMIWEVDEDHDGHVSFAEFERSFERCIADKAGREPRKLHNVVLFALNLGEGSKKLSYDAVTRLTYINHGRDDLEAHMEATFGTMEDGHGLALGDFLRCLRDSHLQRIHVHKIAERDINRLKK